MRTRVVDGVRGGGVRWNVFSPAGWIARGNPEEKIPSGTHLRLWSAQRMLSSLHSLSTGGLQGPLRKVFLLLPRVVNRIGLKTGDGSARTPSGRRLVELFFRGGGRGLYFAAHLL